MLRRARIECWEGQLDASEPTLAAVLQRWMRRERLRPFEVSAASGISRNHLWLIGNGRIARPTPETLRKLATALASDPYSGEVDAAKRRRALRELGAAAGYPDLATEGEPSALVREIAAAGSNPQASAFWAELVRAHPNISPTLQQLIRALIQVHGRPGGEDLLGRLLGEGGAGARLTTDDLATLLALRDRLRERGGDPGARMSSPPAT